MSGKLWADIPDYVGLYQINILGDVRRLPYIQAKTGGFVRLIRMHTLKPQNVAGAAIVPLRDAEGNVKRFALNQIVARAFLDYPPDKTLVILHRDGDPMNCRADNLRFAGSDGEIEEAPRRLTTDEVAEIRRLAGRGVKRKELAKRFRRTPSAISRIVLGSRYRDKSEADDS